MPPTTPVPLPRIVTALIGLRLLRRAAFPWRRGNCSTAPEAGSYRFRAFRRELLGDEARQREIDIVAAEQDVLADGHALELQFAGVLGDGDQGEIGGAAADIDDQDQVADLTRSRQSGCRSIQA